MHVSKFMLGIQSIPVLSTWRTLNQQIWTYLNSPMCRLMTGRGGGRSLELNWLPPQELSSFVSLFLASELSMSCDWMTIPAWEHCDLSVMLLLSLSPRPWNLHQGLRLQQRQMTWQREAGLPTRPHPGSEVASHSNVSAMGSPQ